jgi:5-methylcytosine-specific restriction endonuclease McrA
VKRSPMNRATPGALAWRNKPRKRINRQSVRGAVEAQTWRDRRDAHLAQNPTCILKGVSECWGRLTVHHITPRSMGGTRNDTSALVTACAGHHSYIEENREWARSRGLLGRRGGGLE